MQAEQAIKGWSLRMYLLSAGVIIVRDDQEAGNPYSTEIHITLAEAEDGRNIGLAAHIYIYHKSTSAGISYVRATKNVPRNGVANVDDLRGVI